jgi:DNA-binding XRE family transcriptional regulator
MTFFGIGIPELDHVGMTVLLNMAQLGTVLPMPKRTPPVTAGVEINGNKLRELRKLRGETLEQFAARCEISFGYLGQVERHERPRVNPVIFGRICDALDIPFDSRAVMITPEARRRLRAAA